MTSSNETSGVTNETTGSTTGSTSGVTTGLWPIFESVLGWFRRGPELDTSEEIAKGWEFIISETEERLLKLQQSFIQKTQNELKVLRQMTTNVTWRPKITQHVLDVYGGLDGPTKQLLHDSRLDSSERLACLRAVFDPRSGGWLTFLRQCCWRSSCLIPGTVPQTRVTVTQLESRWTEQQYFKGVTGEIRTMAQQVTFPAETTGLTYRICSDILWSVYLCLSRELVSSLGRSLFEVENAGLFDEVCSMTAGLIQQWSQTTVRKGTYSERSGVVAAHFRSKDELEAQRLAEIKKRGVDAKFSDPTSPTPAFDFQSRARELEAKLKLKEMTRDAVPPSGNIRTRAAELAKILAFRQP